MSGVQSYWDEKSGDDFEDDAIAQAQAMTVKGAHMFLTCIDGSDASDVSFRSVLNLRRKFDHVCIFHAFKGEVTDLQPPTWRPKALHSKYEIELLGRLPSRLYSLAFEDRKGAPVVEVLKKAVDPKSSETPLPCWPDIVVMGHHGRKGPKSQPTTLGSTTDNALRFLKYPCLVIKSLIPPTRKSFIMCVNVNNVSKRGLDILLTIVNPRDSLRLVHFAHGTEMNLPDKKRMKDYYEAELEENGPADSKFEFIEYTGGVPITQAVVDYVNQDEVEVDVFAIAPRATRDRSSITDFIVNNVMCSVLLCKN